LSCICIEGTITMSVSSTSSTERWAVIGNPLALRIGPANGPTISTSKVAASGGASSTATVEPTAFRASNSPLTGATIVSGVARMLTRIGESRVTCSLGQRGVLRRV
jgi:hypothetical protein